VDHQVCSVFESCAISSFCLNSLHQYANQLLDDVSDASDMGDDPRKISRCFLFCGNRRVEMILLLI